MPDKLSVKVRMYRQGLGDCFLLLFQRGATTFNLLVDCGIFYLTKNGSNIMKLVARDIKTATGGRLDAVVLTHDHYDHTSGFQLAKDVFKEDDFIFDQVWVGWTEDENHPKYGAIREHFKGILKGLRVALNGDLKSADPKLQKTINSLTNDFFGYDNSQPLAAEDALGTKGASKIWEYLLTEKAGDVRCFTPGEHFDLTELGIRIYVLGPPEDFDVLESEDPTEEESYRHALGFSLAGGFLAAATGGDDSIFDSSAYMPFDESYTIPKGTAEMMPFFAQNYGFGKRDEWRRIDNDWLSTAGELALWMDDFTNNTCLALAIELIDSGKVMIFPGDAQFGNLMSWQKLTWNVSDGNGGLREVKAKDLLAKTVLYKVGHHGSHNATLKKSGLELMNVPERELVALIPTNREFAKGQGSEGSGGWKMPEEKLLERLEQKAKGRVILADEAGSASKPKKPLTERCKRLGLSDYKTKKFLDKVEFGGQFSRVAGGPLEPLYVQYTLEE